MECAVRGYHDLSGGKPYSTWPTLDEVKWDYCKILVTYFFCVVLYFLGGFFSSFFLVLYFVRNQQPAVEVNKRQTSRLVWDQRVLLGRHFRVLILEQVHLLFTI